MAVSNAPTPNLSSSYRDVIDAMNNRANLELKRPQLADVGAVAATRVDQELTKQRDFAMKMQAEGRIKVDDSVIKPLADSSGIEPSYWNKYKNLYMKPEEIQSYGEQEKLARSFKDSSMSNAARVNPKAASEQALGKWNKENLRVGKSDGSSTGYTYHQIRPDGTSIDTGVEAPEPNKRGGGGSAAPTKIDPDTGELIRINGDNTTSAVTGPKHRPKPGELVTKPDQLYANEKKALSKAQADTERTMKPITDRLDKADALEKDINSNNPNSLLNIQAELAQLAGVPGSRVGFQLMRQEGLNKGLGARLEQAWTRVEGGQALSEANKKALLDYTQSKREELKGQLSSSIDDAVEKHGSNLPDVHPDLIRQHLSASSGRYLGNKAPGMIEAGNIKNIYDRKELGNADGSYSTTSSMSFEDRDGKEVLIPTVINGKRLSQKEAISYYRKTGEHLGKFSSPGAADAYAEKLHEDQASRRPKTVVQNGHTYTLNEKTGQYE